MLYMYILTWDPDKRDAVIDRVKKIVQEKYGIAPEAIVDKSRKAAIVRARQDLFFRAHFHEKMSHSQIGRYIKCDHTTVMHGVRQHEKVLQEKGFEHTV